MNILVVAGNWKQFADFRETCPKDMRLKYAHSREHFQGYHPEEITILMVGQWWLSSAENFEEIYRLKSLGVSIIKGNRDCREFLEKIAYGEVGRGVS